MILYDHFKSVIILILNPHIYVSNKRAILHIPLTHCDSEHEIVYIQKHLIRIINDSETIHGNPECYLFKKKNNNYSDWDL